MTDLASVYRHVLDLRVAADDLNEALVDFDDDWQHAVLMLHSLRLARQTLQVCEAAIEKAITSSAPREPQEIPGVGTMQVRKGSTRKAWDHDGLAKAVISTRLAATGEVPDPFEVRDWITEAASFSYWRVGILRELGIDASDYCESTPGRATVQITTNEGIGS